MINTRVIKGDCIQVMQTLPKRSVDIVVTSPPYNLNIAYGEYKDKKSTEVYLAWFKQVAKYIKKILKDDGSFFLNIAGSNSQPSLPHLVAIQLEKDFIIQNTYHWIKSISIGDKSMGHYKPINSPRYTHNGHEFIFHLTKTGKVAIDRLAVGVPYQDKSNIKRRGHASDKRCRGNVIFIPYKTVQSKDQKYRHPASWPQAVPEYFIKLHGKKNAVVCDPFAGVFTTGLAAKALNCSFIGMDIDKTYCKVGAKLLQAKVEKCGT